MRRSNRASTLRFSLGVQRAGEQVLRRVVIEVQRVQDERARFVRALSVP